jgi:DNA-binding NarL/FixJ family response regulator
MAGGDPTLAARLFGASAAWCEPARLPLILELPQLRDLYEQDVAAARTALGDEAFAVAWTEGQTSPFDVIFADALYTEPDQTPGPTSSPTSERSPYPDRLTAREVEVLRLLASGASNQAIAEHLVLSVKTVERHIANIYTKIGAHGRVEATTFALRHHLLEATARPRS